MVEGEEEFQSLPPTPESIDRGFTFEQEQQPTMSTTTATTPATKKPMFGGVVPNGNGVVWIGGPPKADFSDTTRSVELTPLCYRNLDPVSSMKTYPKRIEGATLKLKRVDPNYSLMSFAEDAFHHMQEHGMDTFFYMKGAKSDGTGAEELFTYHTKYTKAQVDQHIEKLKPTLDHHGLSCLADSYKWLLASLDETLKSTIRIDAIGKATGPQLWMLIVTEIQTESLRRGMILQKEFMALKLSQFKGENVQEYAAKASPLLVELERYGMLPQTHLMDIVDHMTACTKEDFRVLWMTKRKDVNEFMEECAGKDDKTIKLMPNKITFGDLLQQARKDFTNLKHVWGTVPANEQAMISQVKALTAQIKRLETQQSKATPAATGGPSNDGTKKQLKCWNCGKEGHSKKDCPTKGTGSSGGGNGSGSGGGSSGGGDGDSPGKWAAPKDGEAHEKTIDGVKRMWCSKCRGGKGMWTKNHKTAGHKTKEQLAAEKPSGGTGTPSVKLASGNYCQDLFASWGG